jgi:hypothetical protein
MQLWFCLKFVYIFISFQLKHIYQEQKFFFILQKQGRKRPLDTPKRMIERRERERKVEGEI